MKIVKRKWFKIAIPSILVLAAVTSVCVLAITKQETPAALAVTSIDKTIFEKAKEAPVTEEVAEASQQSAEQTVVQEEVSEPEAVEYQYPCGGWKESTQGYIYDKRKAVGKTVPSGCQTQAWEYIARNSGYIVDANPQEDDIAVFGGMEIWFVDSIEGGTVSMSSYYGKVVTKIVSLESATSGSYRFIH